MPLVLMAFNEALKEKGTQSPPTLTTLRWSTTPTRGRAAVLRENGHEDLGSRGSERLQTLGFIPYRNPTAFALHPIQSALATTDP